MNRSQADDLAKELSQLLLLSTPRRRHDYRRMAQLSTELGPFDSSQATPGDDAEFAALLAEYDSLRQECMNSTNNRVQVLIFGAAAIAALVGGALTIDEPQKHQLLLWALFSLAVPLTCIFVLLVWVSEAIRAHRASAFLAGDVEARINAKVGRLVLYWEAALTTAALPRDERRGPSMMALGVVGLVAVAAPAFGIVASKTGWTPLWWPITQIVPGYLLLALSFVYVLGLMPRLKNTGVVVSLWPGED
jgi:hypothetical protein